MQYYIIGMIKGVKEEITAMTKFVGAEYLIACMLIEKRKKGLSYVSLDELGRCGIYVQKMSIEEKIDAVFLTSRSQFYSAIYDFSDYFECEFDGDNEIRGIKLESSKNIDDLEYRFMGYLPKEIFDFLSEVVKGYAA